MISNHQNDVDSLNTLCREIIETSYPLFVIHNNHVTTVPDTPLHTLVEQIYTTAIQTLSLTSQKLPTLDTLLAAVFDPDNRAFLLPETTARLLAVLDVDARACLFAQAIAGVVAFLRSIAARRQPLTTESDVLAELRRFSEGPSRRRMLEVVENSCVWSDCFEKAQIGGMIWAAIEESWGLQTMGEKEVLISVAVEDVDVDNVPAFNDGPHWKREFGVPDVFTIMALN